MLKRISPWSSDEKFFSMIVAATTRFFVSLVERMYARMRRRSSCGSFMSLIRKLIASRFDLYLPRATKGNEEGMPRVVKGSKEGSVLGFERVAR